MSQVTFAIACSGAVAAYCSVVYQKLGDENSLREIGFLAAASVITLYATLKTIPAVSALTLKAGLSGRDINKDSTDRVPESLGIVTGVTFLMCTILMQWVVPCELGVYNAALTSVTLMLFLGFADDVLDLRWSIKIVLSFLATSPLLVFWTNGINIYAGVNGLETGQTVIISAAILVHNFIQLPEASHLLSIYLTLPFFSAAMGLTFFNWYPSQVFVGDSFTYFAGSALAVVGVLGKFSKTLMLFFIPQLINFALSLPQLFRIVPCPRHRLPKLNKKTGKLEPTYNFTLINLWLYSFGPMTEYWLCSTLLLFQIFCCGVGFLVRYKLAALFYEEVL